MQRSKRPGNAGPEGALGGREKVTGGECRKGGRKTGKGRTIKPFQEKVLLRTCSKKPNWGAQSNAASN